MRRMVLVRPVTVVGRDFFGRKSVLRFRPTHKAGWYWNTGFAIVPLTTSLLTKRRRRLVLVHGTKRLNIIEHIAAIRFFGVDGVEIQCPSGWPPYDGSAALVLNALRPHLCEQGSLNRYAARADYHVRHETGRFVRLSSSCTSSLTLDVTVNYRGVGHESFTFNTSDSETLAAILVAPTQGWPRYARIIAEIASAIGWPHKQNIWWPKRGQEAATRHAFALHRALDMLGALAFLCPQGGILVGNIISHTGGHALDLELVRRAALAQAELVLCP